jgi:predicted HTH transcriptional regulator
MDEIIRTSIAFANTRGGRIYIGINDLQEVNGIDREVIKAYAGTGSYSIKEGAEHYCKVIRKALADRSNKALEAVIEPKEIAGKTVIQVFVPEGRNKPYSDVKTQEIWIRRGSNTVRPDPERDLRGLLHDDGRPQLPSDGGVFGGPTN